MKTTKPPCLMVFVSLSLGDAYVAGTIAPRRVSLGKFVPGEDADYEQFVNLNEVEPGTGACRQVLKE